MFDTIHEECGVFGICDPSGETDVAHAAYTALFALQHRGQESCGIVVNNDGEISYHRDLGLVPDVFTKEAFDKLGNGQIAVGHTRYSTRSQAIKANNLPLITRHVKGPMAISFNGSITNASQLRERHELRGGMFHTTGDTEVIAYTITEQKLTSNVIEEAIEKAMYKLEGAYSLAIMTTHKLIAVRDPFGYRPLCLGQMPNGAYVVASESCAFNAIGAEFLRDIMPGEILVIKGKNMKSITTHCGRKPHICVFEYVYTARPDSVIEGNSVHRARLRAGEFLWKEHPVDADVVIGVPDSGLDAALGLSLASGIPYGIGFLKNKYIGRTFILPTQKERENAVRIKLNVIAETVKDKRVIMVDDSIVRGTTSANIVELLRKAGAKEVHMRISSPPFMYPCYYGTDIDSKDKLIACRMSIEEIRNTIGVDSLGYLSIDAVNHLADNGKCTFCDGCFTGKYPSDKDHKCEHCNIK
ncbi:MAG: amidophosphoribosyltransferase [Ruminococcaceae bacterium]|nr:amidophosphoribosyltransferase [Oscillospiraceae bacterium]